MLGYLTSRWQSTGEQKKTSPTWFDRHFSPILLSVAKKACTHPIHTIVTIAFLASYSYLGVLDRGLLESGIEEVSSRVDFHSLLAGSKTLRVGEETSWQWEAEEPKTTVYKDKTAQELALVTLVFPESSTINSAPSQQSVPSNVSAKLLPSSSSSFSTFSHDTSLAFSIPYTEAADFLQAMQEISAPEDAAQSQGSEKEGTREEKKWMMKASKNGSAPGGVRNWIIESWTSFVDLLKVFCLWIQT
ncbi:3-hydroxy-3-methylglutaryl-coenzyme A reductase [Alternaria alternata]|jgi:hydroxymethylglutaryl-CoA reductase (NADPH)|nr:3-hydroxy-3-methylglutaryl-coenzyme A reductase [Alternaria alternata]